MYQCYLPNDNSLISNVLEKKPNIFSTLPSGDDSYDFKLVSIHVESDDSYGKCVFVLF